MVALPVVPGLDWNKSTEDQRRLYARNVAQRYGVDPVSYERQIDQESHFDPKAYNAGSGAAGIAQFMPATAAEQGIDPYDWKAALEAGARYRAQQRDYFGGDERAGLAAYNHGAGNVEKLKQRYGADWEAYLPDETKQYLARITGGEAPPASVQGDAPTGAVSGGTVGAAFGGLQPIANRKPGYLYDTRGLEPVQSGDVPYDAGGLVPAGREDTALRTSGTLRGRLLNPAPQDLGMVPVAPHTEDTSSPLTLLARAYDAGNVDIPVVSDAARAVRPLVGDAAGLIADTTPAGAVYNLAASGLERVGGPALPKAGDVASPIAEGFVPVGALDFGLELAPGIGSADDIARATKGLVREGAVRAGASAGLDRVLPAAVLRDERRGANVFERMGLERTQGARVGQEYGPEVAGGPAKPRVGDNPAFDAIYRTPVSRGPTFAREAPFMDEVMHELAEGLEVNPEAVGLRSREALLTEQADLRASPAGKTAQQGRVDAQLAMWDAIEGRNPAQVFDAISDAYAYRRGTTPRDRAFVDEMVRLQNQMTDFETGELNWNTVREPAVATAAAPPGSGGTPPVSVGAPLSSTPPPPGSAPLGDVGIRSALSAKEEATLQTGRAFGDEGSVQRRVVGAVNPSVDMPRPVHVANQASVGVQSTLRTELGMAERDAYRGLASTFEETAPKYIGPEGRPLAGTWVDYAEKPSFYEASDELTGARELLRQTQDTVLDKVRSEYGVDVGRFTGADPEAVYVPHMQSREQVDQAVAANRNPMPSSKKGVMKERAYDTLSDRVARHPDWQPETDPGALADLHAAQLANAAATNTFKAGIGGKTRLEVLDELYPGLREKRDDLRRQVGNLRQRVNKAVDQAKAAGRYGQLSEARERVLTRRAEGIESTVSALGEDYGPQLSYLSGQLRELRLEAGRVGKVADTAAGDVERGAARAADFNTELKAAEEKLSEYVTRVRTAAVDPERFAMGPDFRYHEPKTAEAMRSVQKRDFGNAFIDGAIEAGNMARAGGLGPDFSPLTIQGSLGAFSHPEVAVKEGAGLVRSFFQSPEAFANAVDPELVKRFEFASGRQVGSLSDELLGNKGVSLPGKPVAKFNQRLQQVVDYGTLKAFENDSNLLMKLGQESQNIADHEAANSISKFIPRINNAETGRSLQRVKLEGVLPTSRSFTAQPFVLAKDFTSGLAKVVAGGGLLGREKLALMRGTSMLGTLLTLSVGSALVSAETNGKDPVEAVKEVIDPSSGRFLHVILGNKGSIGLGGPFRSAFLGVFRTATEGPEGAYKYATGRLQPLLGAGEDIATNRDWKGDTVREGSAWHQVLQSVGHLAKSANLLSGGVISGAEEGGLAGAATQTAAGLGGVNYQERTAYDERDRAAREKFGKPYGELFPQDKAAIDALGLAPQSKYKTRADEVHAPIVAEQQRVEDLFKAGDLDKRLPEYYHDLGQRKLQAGHDLETQFAKDFAGFDKDKYRTALDGYYATEKKDERGSPDFDATEAARQEYLEKLPEDQRRWISEALQVSREKQTPLRQEYLTYIDAKKKAGYFKDGLTPRERTALDAAHVDLDLQSWYFNGGVKDKSGGQLNSKAAVDQALQMIEQRGLKNRAVYINGADRDLAAPENRPFWQEKGSLVANFTGDAYSKKYGDQEAQKQYARGNVKSPRYADLSPGEKAEVDAAIRREVKAGSPELEAVMAYAGVGGNATDKVYAVSPEAAAFVTELNKKYGKTVPKAGWQIVQRR